MQRTVIFVEEAIAVEPQKVQSTEITNYNDFDWQLVHRFKMNDPEKTWYYVDLKTGQVVLKHEKKSRLERWLYNGLHSLDFSFLLYKRPLWDIVVIVLMLGGLAASSIGLVLTWKWLKRKTEKKRKAGLKKKEVLIPSPGLQNR